MKSGQIQKLPTAKVKRCPAAGTPEHVQWRSKVSEGMRKAQVKRRRAGVLTFTQTAVKYDLPVSFVKRKAALGELRVLRAGSRSYIRITEAERVFGETAA
jgi:hypothetical protein